MGLVFAAALPQVADSTKNPHKLYINPTPIQHFLNVLSTWRTQNGGITRHHVFVLHPACTLFVIPMFPVCIRRVHLPMPFCNRLVHLGLRLVEGQPETKKSRNPAIWTA